MPTSIKQALKKWEEATGRKAAEAKEIKLIGVYPPIEKMEGPFHLLTNLERLSLSSNMISTIANLQNFKNLKVGETAHVIHGHKVVATSHDYLVFRCYRSEGTPSNLYRA